MNAWFVSKVQYHCGMITALHLDCIGALALKAGYNSLRAKSWSSMTDDSFRDCFSSLFIFEALELLRIIRWHGVDMVEETL